MASTAAPSSSAQRTRLPLRAELGERREHGALGVGDDVAEQRHRRHEAGVADPAQRGVGVGRAPRRARRRGAARRARASTERAEPGAVVADAEQVQPGHGRGRGQRRVRSSSRQAS